MAFMRGKSEHMGNRNYFGQDNIELAKKHKIHEALSKIARVRKNIQALQSGLQVNIELAGNKAAFYRVLVLNGISQTALVLLNKGDHHADFNVNKYMQEGNWISQMSDDEITINQSNLQLNAQVAAHSVAVWLREGEISNALLVEELQRLMKNK